MQSRIMSWSELNEKGIGRFISLEKYGLSTFSLKIIAVVTMFIDHFALLFCSDYRTLYVLFRSVGRLSFPIFCFILAEGFFHTSNRMKHAIRLGVFALLSEIPYDMMYGKVIFMSQQNVMFTLFIGYMLIWGLSLIADYRVNYPKSLLMYVGAGHLNLILELVVIIAGLSSAYFLKCSYSYAGVMLIMCFYVFRQHHLGKLFSNIVFNMGMYTFGIQWWGAVSVFPIALYNGKLGKTDRKHLFYLFYPLHIVGLVILKIIL